MGGQYLREAGMHTLVDTAAIAGMGLFEASDKLKALVRTYRQLTAILRTEPPDLLVLIDFPEFNLRLAKIAKQAGVRVFYYISPQVWAWRKRRVHTIARRVDRLAAVFPFEPAFYAAHGGAVDFVGHPLVDRVRPNRSRAETLPRLRERVRQHQILLVQGDTYNLIHAADLALVASGTATLETALLERPMVIVYRLAPLTYALARLIVRVPFIGMPNLIAERRVVPELIQREVTSARIATEARQLLENPQAYRLAQEGLREVRRRLGPGGAAERAATLALEMLEKK